MVKLREIRDREYLPRKTQIRLISRGALALTKLFLRSPGDIKKLQQREPLAERYIRPPREYELTPYSPSMKIPDSNEKYLRPTLYCNCRAPEIVAMAHQLGAYKVSDYEFAEAAFHFVKEKLPLEILPLNEAEETLKRGTGTCFHLISLFIALCRSAGIKARYKMFAMNMIQAWYDTTVGVDPTVKKWYDSMGYFMLEGEGEVFVDGKWMVAHVGPKAERQAAAGIPITRFGEDSIGIWFFPIPGTIMRMESIPYGIGTMIRVGKLIAPGSMERVNVSIQHQIEIGRKIIKEAGGLEAYDTNARKKRGPSKPHLEMEGRNEIIFNK
jgi:hypothetical protein